MTLYEDDASDGAADAGQVEPIPGGITRAHLLHAMEKLRRGAPHGFGPSVKYDVLHLGERYPPKAVVGLAAEEFDGVPRGPKSFHAGLESRCFKTLEKNGFAVVPKTELLLAPTVWALLCNPDTFDIEAAADRLDEGTWILPTGDPGVGDRLIFWKAKGNSGMRGVVALGEVLDPPTLRSPDSASAPFWRQPQDQGPARRMLVRYLRPINGPLWETEDTEALLSRLRVSRAQGNKLYKVQPEEWLALLDALGGWPWDSPSEAAAVEAAQDAAGHVDSDSGGQGWSLSPEHRKAVELRAMTAAREYLETQGFECTDTSANRPYDLVATRGEQRLFVEVKGTKTGGGHVFLTKNEVAHAQANPGRCMLFVLRHVSVLESPEGCEGIGGDPMIIESWVPEEAALTPLAYRYIVQEPPA